MREGYLIAFAQDHQSLETHYKILLTIGSLEQKASYFTDSEHWA